MADQHEGPTQEQMNTALWLATFPDARNAAEASHGIPVSQSADGSKEGQDGGRYSPGPGDFYSPVFGAVDEALTFAQNQQPRSGGDAGNQGSASPRGKGDQQEVTQEEQAAQGVPTSLPSYQSFYQPQQAGAIEGLNLDNAGPSTSGDTQFHEPPSQAGDIVVPDQDAPDTLGEFPSSQPKPPAQPQLSEPTTPPKRGGSPPPRVPPKELPRPVSRTVPKTSRRQSKLTNLDRRQICEYANEHKSATQEDIAQKWSIDRSSVSKILKYRDKWMNILPGSRAAKVIKHRGGRFPQLEAELVHRCRARAEGSPDSYLGDKHIKEMALEIAVEQGVAAGLFRASNGWLDAFKERASIRQGKFVDEDSYGIFDNGDTTAEFPAGESSTADTAVAVDISTAAVLMDLDKGAGAGTEGALGEAGGDVVMDTEPPDLPVTFRDAEEQAADTTPSAGRVTRSRRGAAPQSHPDPPSHPKARALGRGPVPPMTAPSVRQEPLLNPRRDDSVQFTMSSSLATSSALPSTVAQIEAQRSQLYPSSDSRTPLSRDSSLSHLPILQNPASLSITRPTPVVAGFDPNNRHLGGHLRSASTTSSPSYPEPDAADALASIDLDIAANYMASGTEPVTRRAPVHDLPSSATATVRSFLDSNGERVSSNEAFDALQTVIKYLEAEPNASAAPKDYMVLGELLGRMKERRDEQTKDMIRRLSIRRGANALLDIELGLADVNSTYQ